MKVSRKNPINETLVGNKIIKVYCYRFHTKKWLEIYTSIQHRKTTVTTTNYLRWHHCRYSTKISSFFGEGDEWVLRKRSDATHRLVRPQVCLTLNQKYREVRVYMTRTCCRESVPLVKTAFAPPSIRVRITVTQSPFFFSAAAGTSSGGLAVVTMAWERWSKGFDSHWRIQPSIVSLPPLCRRQQPSSALTVRLASLHVAKNSRALWRHSKTTLFKIVLTGKGSINFFYSINWNFKVALQYTRTQNLWDQILTTLPLGQHMHTKLITQNYKSQNFADCNWWISNHKNIAYVNTWLRGFLVGFIRFWEVFDKISSKIAYKL